MTSRNGLLVFLAVTLAGALAACGDGLDAASGTGVARPGTRTITVGSANFPENELLADIYAGALKDAGLHVATQLDIGSREVLFPALEKGQINVVPEYTGALLSYLVKGKPIPLDTTRQLLALKTDLSARLTVLAPSPAQDQDSVACNHNVVQRYALTSLKDLARVSRQLTYGGPPETAIRSGFASLRGLKRDYGIVFRQFRPLDEAGPLTVAALKSGAVDCANLFTTQSAITVDGFVPLTDPKGFAQSDAVVPLITKRAATARVTHTLNAVSSHLTTDNLKEMVKRVEVDKDDPMTVAEEFLHVEGL